ncbi:MAG: hypothetical protein AMXMBFR7_41050 [Planctomycetota bacterium]
MAVSDTATPDSATGAGTKFEAITALMPFVVIGLIALLVISVASLLVVRKMEDRRLRSARDSWDAVFVALKDKETGRERVEALEKTWDDVRGTEAHPYVMLLLAQIHFEDALRPERPPSERSASLDRATKVFELAHKEFRTHVIFGALAAEGLGLAQEQAGSTEAAQTTFKQAVTEYEQHFLFPKLCYQLGRTYWYQARALEAKNEDASSAREEAKRWISKALQSSSDSQFDRQSWRSQAKYLQSLLDSPGIALPDGKAPPRRAAAPAPANP